MIKGHITYLGDGLRARFGACNWGELLVDSKTEKHLFILGARRTQWGGEGAPKIRVEYQYH